MTKILKTIEEKNVIHTIVSGDFKIDYAAYGLVRGEEAKKAAKTTKTTKTIEEKKAAKKAYNAAYYQAHKAERKAAYQAKKAAKMIVKIDPKTLLISELERAIVAAQLDPNNWEVENFDITNDFAYEISAMTANSIYCTRPGFVKNPVHKKYMLNLLQTLRRAAMAS